NTVATLKKPAYCVILRARSNARDSSSTIPLSHPPSHSYTRSSSSPASCEWIARLLSHLKENEDETNSLNYSGTVNRCAVRGSSNCCRRKAEHSGARKNVPNFQ